MSKSAAFIRVKEHFEEVARLKELRSGWQERIASEAVALKMMGLSLDPNGKPPANFFYITSAIDALLSDPKTSALINEKPEDEAFQLIMKQGQAAIKKAMSNNRNKINFSFQSDIAPDMADMMGAISTARAIISETNNTLKQLEHLVGNYELSEAYVSCFEEIRNRTIEMLKNSNDLPAKNKIWSHLDPEAQIVWLQKQVDSLAAIQSEVSGLPIAGTKAQWNDGMADIYGAVDVDMNEKTTVKDSLHLNSRKGNPTMCDSLSTAIDCVLHEQYHQFHNQLARAVRFGLIDESHPLYEDALYFDGMWAHNGYVSEGNAYRVQPDERYALGFSDSIGGFAKSLTLKLNEQATNTAPITTRTWRGKAAAPENSDIYPLTASRTQSQPALSP